VDYCALGYGQYFFGDMTVYIERTTSNKVTIFIHELGHHAINLLHYAGLISSNTHKRMDEIWEVFLGLLYWPALIYAVVIKLPFFILYAFFLDLEKIQRKIEPSRSVSAKV